MSPDAAIRELVAALRQVTGETEVIAAITLTGPAYDRLVMHYRAMVNLPAPLVDRNRTKLCDVTIRKAVGKPIARRPPE